MTCTPFKLADGTTGIMCSRSTRYRKCVGCGRMAADLLCDWKKPKKKSGTCDAAICSRCTFSPAPDKDLCPAHREEFKVWARRPGAQRRLELDGKPAS